MSAPRILIAGVGNIFHADDGFGVEVARRLQDVHLPQGVRVVDFGIRAFDLACAMTDGFEAVVLVDAARRGGQPGTLYVIEPDMNIGGPGPSPLNPHALDPTSLIRWVQDAGGSLPRMVLVGCEPAVLGSEEDILIELSAPVRAAVDAAMAAIRALVDEIRSEVLQASKPCTN